ncbi:hypothetical protein LS81_002800 [Helicobacter trogontum]|uniref:Uncharacterized protein n=1 Tax=Helicobacter trogontum TaxID=50960 RepID=A0A4U8SDD8_9HELI|nr:alpha-2,3-sialyltransferase [Helicobacter trogontum]TLD84149.1 hypothetical protein LS81_002800 [Helicobacter trogontum]
MRGYVLHNSKSHIITKDVLGLGGGVSYRELSFEKYADLKKLTFLSKHYNVKFYSLCPNSPLTSYFPLAPITGNTFIPSKKPDNYTKDILIPKGNGVESMRDILRLDLHLYDEDVRKRNRIKNNIYFRIFDDLMRLPRDIKHYLQNLKKG